MISPTEICQLSKTIWSQDDFEQMGWHDNLVHAITFDFEKYEFILDIDYICAWVSPDPPSPGYSFWLAPATLVFKNVPDFKSDLEGPPSFQILGITRKDFRPPLRAGFAGSWTWVIELANGWMEFSATGFTQYIRRNPVRISEQHLTLEQRGGISFAQEAIEIR